MIDPDIPVKVYRNLKHGRKAPMLYSVMQKGKVVARLNRVIMSNCTFHVNKSGRMRCLKQKRKNVHAFVVGKIENRSIVPQIYPAGCFGQDENGRDFPCKITYKPEMCGWFFNENGKEAKGAMGVLLNEHGMTACYTY